MKRFWAWYEKHYALNLVIATILFLLQAFHLYWLATDVVAVKVFGQSFFVFPEDLSWFYALIDYTEIPALISVSLIYINQLRKGVQVKRSVLYLIFLNLQWFHLFWITDEVVVENFTGQTYVAIPTAVALLAIAIDYLEIPVMIETAIKAIRSLKKAES